MDLSYSLNTFYLLTSGLLVMWMAAGFAMLEAGLVRAKNTTEILKNLRPSFFSNFRKFPTRKFPETSGNFRTQNPRCVQACL